MASNSRIQLENWLKTISISNSNRVLDIGGSQNPILGRVRIIGYDVPLEYKILDLKSPHETKRKPDIVIDIQDYHDSLEKYFNHFDVVFCIEVSEYWYNPLKALKNINSFLKQGGILYISFHTLYGLHNPKGEDCLRYSKNAIYKLSEKTDFKIIEIIPRELTQQGKNFYHQFCKAEGMRLDYSNKETYHSGYLVKMQKI